MNHNEVDVSQYEQLITIALMWRTNWNPRVATVDSYVIVQINTLQRQRPAAAAAAAAVAAGGRYMALQRYRYSYPAVPLIDWLIDVAHQPILADRDSWPLRHYAIDCNARLLAAVTRRQLRYRYRCL